MLKPAYSKGFKKEREKKITAVKVENLIPKQQRVGTNALLVLCGISGIRDS